MQENKLAIFEEKEIRREWYKDDWYFSVIDVIEVLVENNKRPRKYWSDLKQKLITEGFVEVSEKIGQLKMMAKDGKMRLTDVADTKTLLRIIQTIPSPKAEPFKRWLAQVGTERLEEIVNPELAITNLAEVTANEMHNTNNSHGLSELKVDVHEAGKITGKARKEIEEKIGKKVAEKTNYNSLTQNKRTKLNK